MLFSQFFALSLLARFQGVTLFSFTLFDAVEIPLQSFRAVAVFLRRPRCFALIFQGLEGFLILSLVRAIGIMQLFIEL
ncbi:hypothetical protein ATO11_20755 [Pseudaestuariivita atlantica]|uniref:Uncharacterized protein n=1 Tax=Pseudaestuariivita atlantica TaxID=1317121 RepID=A0A0L1JJ69_9RHOB|nr:hypothetical protein ATO11_20755 [Pseudaestuariivita atlantica]